jgi:hypothetical protein
MRVLTRKTATLAGTLAMVGSGLVVAASPASAATSCYGDSCNGVNPASSVCQNDAVTVDTGFTEVELRYSRTCRAAWARKVQGPTGSTIKITNTAGKSFSVHVSPGATGYTLMVNDANLQSQACEYLDGGGQSCTSLY